ncbi:MAG: Hsp20/alpha crystallin family protein [Rubellimicrobium sp.]|nr:Hsp20/alpha crystallin family protein [Rubellimicrobium sp.]
MAENADKTPATPDETAPAARGDWPPFDSLRREVDRLFDDFNPFGWALPQARPGFGSGWRRRMREGWAASPAMDVVEKDGSYEISVELPGIDEGDIEVKVADRMLTIRGEKKEETEDRSKGYHLSERRFGSFQRSFQLPPGVDADAITAGFAKGVLTVTLPKSADAQQAERRIAVQSK